MEVTETLNLLVACRGLKMINFLDSKKISKLTSNNSFMEGYITDLYDYFMQSLEGSLPNKFYVVPWETGLGKTAFVQEFVAEWKAEGFSPGGSILIILKTKAEIEEFVECCCLGALDYSIYTSDEKYEKSGLGIGGASKARVLLTTQEMVRQRLSKKPFNSAVEFFYKGQPRTLRVWDETADRAESIHIRVDDICKLFGSVRPYAPNWVEGLEEFYDRVRAATVGDAVQVPVAFGSGTQFTLVDDAPPYLVEPQREVVKQLKAAAGRTLYLARGSKYGTTLVGAGAALPHDLAPMFVMDASARVRQTYNLWHEADGNVELLPIASRDFANLKVRIWKQGAGLTALVQSDRRARILKGIATAINSRPDEEWLVVGYKSRELFDLDSELSKHLDRPENVSFLHWGRHYGTNAFRTVKNVVVISGLAFAETAYQATYMASKGVAASDAVGNEWVALRPSEIQSNLLQAISRGNVRNGVDGGCGECTVHLVISHNPDPVAIVDATFPGCTVEVWEPFEKALKGNAKAVFDELKRRADEGFFGTISKEEIRRAAGIARLSSLSHVLAKAGFAERMGAIGVKAEYHGFVFERVTGTVTSLSEYRLRSSAQNDRTPVPGLHPANLASWSG